jgi:hypothetical protein
MFSGIPQVPNVTKCVTTDAFCALVCLGPKGFYFTATEIWMAKDIGNDVVWVGWNQYGFHCQ